MDPVSRMVESICGSLDGMRMIPIPADIFVEYASPRLSAITRITRALSHHDIFVARPNNVNEDLIIGLELGCYEYAKTQVKNVLEELIWSIPMFEHNYLALVTKIVSNIRYDLFDAPSVVFDGLISGKLSPVAVAGTSSQELAPEIHQACIDRINARKNYVKAEKVYTHITCVRCKGNRTVIRRLYSRSLDEGVESIIECKMCNLKMRE